MRQDVRHATPAGPFDVVLCRNLAFTYFDQSLQRQVLDRLVGAAPAGGALVIGRSEHLPHGHRMTTWSAREKVYAIAAPDG